MTTQQPQIADLRAALMDTLRHLGTMGRDGRPLDAEQVKAQVSIANTMNDVAKTLVDSAKVEVDFLKATDQTKSSFFENEKDTPRLPSAGAHAPFGNVTRHHING